jgi:hypothetical protein
MPESLTTPRLPKYRHYKPKNLAVVRIEGKDHYLGPPGSEASREKYRRLIATWLAGLPRVEQRQPVEQSAADLSVVELLVAYLRFADGYYVKNGRPTSEPTTMTDPVTDPSRPSPEPRTPGRMLQDWTTRLALVFPGSIPREQRSLAARFHRMTAHWNPVNGHICP